MTNLSQPISRGLVALGLVARLAEKLKVVRAVAAKFGERLNVVNVVAADEIGQASRVDAAHPLTLFDGANVGERVAAGRVPVASLPAPLVDAHQIAVRLSVFGHAFVDALAVRRTKGLGSRLDLRLVGFLVRFTLGERLRPVANVGCSLDLFDAVASLGTGPSRSLSVASSADLGVNVLRREMARRARLPREVVLQTSISGLLSGQNFRLVGHAASNVIRDAVKHLTGSILLATETLLRPAIVSGQVFSAGAK